MAKRPQKPARRRPAAAPRDSRSAPRRGRVRSDHPAPPIRTVAFVSLGCPKNLVDSEKMLGLLAEDGLMPVSDPAGADAIVINTCGFLEAAKEESLTEIRRAAVLRRQGPCRRLVVAGCLVQRHRAKLLEWCPDIDALIGVFDRDRIVQAVRPRISRSRIAGHPASTVSDLAPDLPVYSSIAANATLARRARHLSADTPAGKGYYESDAARLRLTPRHYAYLRLSEGCNQNCAFCTIPSIRGKMRSKPPDAVLAEARELFADGAFELNLIGQDTTSYGQDIGYTPGLAGLLAELDRLARRENPGESPGAGAWLRLMYAYPSCLGDEVIDAIAGLSSVVKYIDMPLQHINDLVLERMRRRTSRKLIETLLDKLRRRVTGDPGNPGVTIRTTFISGFPGETEDQHRELVEFVRGFGFDAVGVFPYSPEPGTPAGTMHQRGEAVPAEVTARRVGEIMQAQQEVVFARNARLAQRGVEMDVLIDSAAASPLPSEGEGKGEGASEAAGNMEEPGVRYAAPDSLPPLPSQGEGRGEGVSGRSVKEPPGRIPLPRGSRLYLGRTYQQAPQIDALTYLCSRQKLSPGEVVRGRITDYCDYDLIAQPLADLDRALKLPVLDGT